MKFFVFITTISCFIALTLARTTKDAPIQRGCTEGEVNTDRKASCICNANKWICSFSTARSCKYGPQMHNDGALREEGGVKCLCADGKWYCSKPVDAAAATPNHVEKRVKRAVQKLKSKYPMGCQEAKLSKKRGMKCVCRNGKWICTNGKGEACKIGKETFKDGMFHFNPKARMICFCTNGTPICNQTKTHIRQKGKRTRKITHKPKHKPKHKPHKRVVRVKRQRDVCRFGPYTVPHGKVYEFGLNCDCDNGKFKCKKYSGFRSTAVTSREVSQKETYISYSRMRKDTAQNTGDSCAFVKAGKRITRLNGQRFGYGLRCECTDGKTSCIPKRV